MRILPSRLGPKLNLSLLAFMLVLGAAIAALMLFGFKRTQTDATSRSREGLEEQARTELLGVSAQEADVGRTIVGQAVLAGEHGAQYMVEIKRAGGSVPWDSSKLTAGAQGELVDATPDRSTDVWVPARAAGDPALERDLEDSAALDALFPTLMQNEGDAVAVYFIATNGMTRAYPPNRVHQELSPNFDPFSLPGFEAFRGTPSPPPNIPAWIEPHEGPAGQGLLVTAITPVYDGTAERGA